MIRQEEKGIQIGRKEVKLSVFFADGIDFSTEKIDLTTKLS